MRALRVAMKLALTAAGVLAAAAGFRQDRREPQAPPPAPVRRRRLMLKSAVGTLLVAAVLVAVGGLIFMYTGFYPIAADRPHFDIVRWALQTGRTRSVQFHSRHITAPVLRDATLIRHGLPLFREHCEPCHGAPGVGPKQMGRGINPTPPPLMTAVLEWTDEQVYWIIVHGLKMSGMPAFGARLSEMDAWAITAFLRRIPWLSPEEYAQWAAAVENGPAADSVRWLPTDDYGFAELAADGNPARGRELLSRYGCVTCHVVPPYGTARVGPPLTTFADRQYIAGRLVNLPRSAVAWIRDPQAVEPDTAMPNLNVDARDALDIVAYLYSIHDSRRLRALRQTLQP